MDQSKRGVVDNFGYQKLVSVKLFEGGLVMNIWQEMQVENLKFQGVDFPEFKSRQIGGVEVLSVTDSTIGLGKIQCVFQRYVSGRGVPLVESALSEMLGMESGFQDKMDTLGADFSFSANRDFVFVSIVALTDQLTKAWDLFMEELQNPRFSQSRLDVWKKQQEEVEKITWSKGKAIASKKIKADVLAQFPQYADTHLHNCSSSIQLPEMESALGQLWQNLLFLGFSGNVPEALEEKVLQNANQKNAVPTPVSFLTKPWEMPELELEQTSMRCAQIVPNKKDANFPMLYWTNILLAGFFGSRLNKVIREEKGLSYGVHGGFVHHQNVSYWNIQSEIKKGSEAEVKAILEHEMANLHTTITAEEFNKAQSYVAGNISMQFDSPFAVFDMLLNEILTGGNAPTIKTRWNNIFGITHDQFVESSKNAPYALTGFKSLFLGEE
ncbi:MAG: zinc protease [Luteibaculaceae bacterium]